MTVRTNERIILLAAVTIACAIVAAPALAHTIGAVGAGFTQGFLHPFHGLDHLLALVGLGVWSGQLGRPHAWRLAVAFMIAVTAGFAVGSSSFALPLVDLGIAGSVLLLGLLVLFKVACRPGTAVVLAALFGIVHGHAHGTELLAAAAPSFYVAGFLATMAVLYGTGVASALMAPAVARRAGTWSVRVVGFVIAVTGTAMVTF